ncbi:hypothetical protein NQT74_10065 [Alteromonas stellipolaris]|uniref:hypothetical protein n=1 Tax=Alteromonas stellipolaris TaxID=233316 RepID=UPI002117CC60|nr:hypothetical protein [Alteromonas stellipolaris]MCQ8848925.1 hypothetical protein [Alteromonas stellipolaris]
MLKVFQDVFALFHASLQPLAFSFHASVWSILTGGLVSFAAVYWLANMSKGRSEEVASTKK